jgi:protein gp37
MNRTGIEYTDFTWNPITGCLMPDSCAVRRYCFANKVAQNLRGQCGYDKENPFKPTLHENRLQQPKFIKKPSRIFTCDMGDMWGDWVPEEWIEAVMNVIRQCHRHTFLLLTKNPQNYDGHTIPSNCWLGTTINKQDEVGRIWDIHKVRTWEKVEGHEQVIRWVSFEPLYSEISARLDSIDWVVIGAQTKPEYQPKQEWVRTLIYNAKAAGAKVFLKNNLRYEVIDSQTHKPLLKEIPGRAQP